MNNRRRYKGEIHYQKNESTRSHHRKPPHGNWQPTVPSWEKKFCYSVGLVPWHKLLETKKSMYLYENVVQWNDSAGEEAFHNAKNRFWAKINGLPCDISLPGPNIYIDEVDWDSDIDPELYLDLEKEQHSDVKDKGEEVVIFGSSLLNQSFLCTGWGEAEEELQKTGGVALNSGYQEHVQNVNNETSWDNNVPAADGGVVDNEWDSCGWKNNCNNVANNYNNWKNVDDRTGANLETCWNDSYGWNDSNNSDNHYNSWRNVNSGTSGNWETCWNDSYGWNNKKLDNNCDSWKNANDRSAGNWDSCLNNSYGWKNDYNNSDNKNWKNVDDSTGGNWEAWDGNARKREGASWHMSRYRTSRFQGDDYQMDRGWWRNGRGRKRVNFVC